MTEQTRTHTDARLPSIYDQGRALTDAELRSFYDDPRADLSLLSQAEQERLLTLTEDAPSKPSVSNRPPSSLDDAMMRYEEGPTTGRGRETLPAIGGAIGGLAGGVPGAVAGGAAGALGRDLLRANEGAPGTPRTAGAAARNVGVEGGIQGALTGAGNLIGRGVAAGGRAVADRAVPMVRSALKPVWAEVRRRANVEGTMPSAVANSQARFIVDKQLRTPEQADALVKSLGGQIDQGLANVPGPIDTASRVPRYLGQLMKRTERQALPAGDRSAVQRAGREVVDDSPLSETVTSQVERQVPGTILDASGQPTTRRVVEDISRRQLRGDVTPTEGMDIARQTSVQSTKRAWGSEAGAVGAKEAEKTIERAVRDAVKQAAPQVKPMLRDQGRAMDARRLLDRSAWRDSNRDALGMGGIAGLANGRPLIALLMQGLKEGQLGAGLAAGRYGPNIARSGGAAGTSAEQLMRLVQALARNQTPTEPPE